MSEVQHGEPQTPNLAEIPETDLTMAQAFELASQEGQSTQEGQRSEPQPLSTSPAGISPTPTPDPNDPLAPLEVSTLLSHPTLGPKLKSHIDTEWANQSRGTRAQWEQEYEQSRVPQIQQQVTEQLLGTWFDGLEPDELGTYLAEHPNLAAAYASHKATQAAVNNPPPVETPNPAMAQVLARIRLINQRLNGAGLPDEVRTKLDPVNYRNQGDAGLDKWESDVDNAVIDHKASLRSNETLEARRTAELAENDTQSGLFNQGSPVGVLGDLENDPPQLLMERALAIEAANARKR